MGKKDPRVDAYIERAAPFAKPILKHLRKVVHRGCPEVEETIKWGMPHFDYKGLICGMAAFKAHCAFHFWKGELIMGKSKKAEEAMGQFGRITSIKDLPSETMLVGWVRKAAALKDKGISVPSRKRTKRKPVPMPRYFSNALARNAKARNTFEDLSPSGKREYVEWLVSAKREETRDKRLNTAVEWLSQGKPHNWRYMK